MQIGRNSYIPKIFLKVNLPKKNGHAAREAFGIPEQRKVMVAVSLEQSEIQGLLQSYEDAAGENASEAKTLLIIAPNSYSGQEDFKGLNVGIWDSSDVKMAKSKDGSIRPINTFDIIVVPEMGKAYQFAPIGDLGIVYGDRNYAELGIYMPVIKIKGAGDNNREQESMLSQRGTLKVVRNTHELSREIKFELFQLENLGHRVDLVAEDFLDARESTFFWLSFALWGAMTEKRDAAM